MIQLGLILVAFLMMGTHNVIPQVPYGESNEYANNNLLGQSCSGADILECEILAEIHNDFVSLFGYLESLISAVQDNTNQVKQTNHELQIICQHISPKASQESC